MCRPMFTPCSSFLVFAFHMPKTEIRHSDIIPRRKPARYYYRLFKHHQKYKATRGFSKPNHPFFESQNRNHPNSGLFLSDLLGSFLELRRKSSAAKATRLYEATPFSQSWYWYPLFKTRQKWLLFDVWCILSLAFPSLHHFTETTGAPMLSPRIPKHANTRRHVVSQWDVWKRFFRTERM